MKANNLLLGLAPWVLFSVIADRIGAQYVGTAALVAGLGSLVLVIRGAATDGVKVIDVAGVVTFAGLALIGYSGSAQTQQWLVDYGRGGCAAVLALVMAISAITVPFTEQYARAEVDSRYWSSPVFRAMNRRISLVWAGLIAVMAASHLLAGALAASGNERPIVNLALNWGVPILIVLKGMKATEKIAAEAKGAKSVAA
jgi:hypothetical protein